jgi:cation diffusion facilitator family transporter
MADVRPALTKFAWLSIAAAVLTIALKGAAYILTGSVGLLSDALESVVNLVAALIALIVLSVADKEPDEEHAYGHYKAEYFSSGLQGGLILVAADSIVLAAIPRLIHPQPVELGVPGVVVSGLASLVNLVVARRLLRAGKEYRSITLEADAHHLMADVWTSVGVLIGVGVTVLTGWARLDPIVALVVAVNIVWTGTRLIRRSLLGLLDTALPPAERAKIDAVLRPYRERDGIEVHAIRTRQAGARNFISMHVLVPGDWSVHKGHRLLEAIEHDLHAALPGTTVFTHLESLDDPASWADTRLDRASATRT